MEQPPRRGPLIWPWLLALLVVVLGGLGAYWYFTKADEKPVPLVVGQTQQVAEANLREEGFEVKVARARRTPNRPKRRDRPEPPPPAPSSRRARPVGDHRLERPGEGHRARRDGVSNRGRRGRRDRVGRLRREDHTRSSLTKPPGHGRGRKCLPPGSYGRRKARSSRWRISKGGKPVAVPDVVGTTSSEATKTLREAGFGVNVVSVPSEKAAGHGRRAEPAPGATAKQGTSVRLNVAQAPGETTTDHTTTTTTRPRRRRGGQRFRKSSGQLADGAEGVRDEGLKVESLRPVGRAGGRILAQGKTAGTKARRAGTSVHRERLEGAPAAPPTKVPSVRRDDGQTPRHGSRTPASRCWRSTSPAGTASEAVGVVADSAGRREHPARVAGLALRRRLSRNLRLRPRACSRRRSGSG